MKSAIGVYSALIFAIGTHAQSTLRNVTPDQLQMVTALPLGHAVERREEYKVPLRAAYARQIALVGKDCSADASQGQQQYNICMGKVSADADRDFAIFYNNLQMLCHDQAQLLALQASERTWEMYRDSAMKAAHAAWPDGTGAPGFSGQVYLSLVRDYMRELHEIYGLNIAQ